MSDDPRVLHAQCTRFLPGHGLRTAADQLAEAAAWCREHDVRADVYGDGAVINDFEAEIAALLGQEAAVFMPSGTMAQQIAARLHAEASGRRALGMHPTCHLELHEHKGYAWLHGLTGVPVGSRLAPTTAKDLAACRDPLAALVVELPLREIGGVLPAWDELAELKETAKQRDVPLHLDGARLWEAQAAYGKGFAEITAGFASVYVSFYKGIGALSGAMLAGPRDFIEASRVWLRRHGGNLYTLTPYVVSARLGFAERLPRMPAYRAEARRVGAVLARIPGLALRPGEPQVNMFHLGFDRSADAVKAARNRIAKEDKVWLFGGPSPGERPETATTELSFGDAAAALGDDEIAGLFRKLLDLAVKG